MIQHKRFLPLLCAALLLSGQARAEDPTIAHAITSHGSPKHGPDFRHFDFANQDAPKGGTLIRSAVQIGELDEALRRIGEVIERRNAPIGSLVIPLVREAFAGDPRLDALLAPVGLDRASIDELFAG